MKGPSEQPAEAATVASRKPDRRLPWLRLLLVVLLSIPAAAFGLWEHDTAHLERLGLCMVWLAFGYAWGWQDRSTTVADFTQGASDV